MPKQKAPVRFEWIDLAKFTSIFLVILYHSPPSIGGTPAGVALAHIRLPALFFYAGLLFNFSRHSSFPGFIKHRSKQLLIPYFCFFLLFYLFWLLVGKNFSPPEEQAAPFYQPLVEYLYGRPFLIDWPLWFIAALFCMQSLFYLFQKTSRTVSAIILFLIPFIPRLVDLSKAPWMLDNVCEFIFYYGIASLYKKEFFRFMETKRRFFIGLLALIIHLICNFQLLKHPGNYLSPPLHLLCGISLILPFSVTLKAITDHWRLPAVVQYLAKNTIIILACHTYGIQLITLLILRAMQADDAFFDGRYDLKLAIAAGVMVLMWLPVCLIDRYFPFILGRGKIFEANSN